MLKRMSAFILAGGVGKRLSLLTTHRAKPAVPFAGKYRIIDFTLTNCVRSGIVEVFVLAQYISRSLEGHLGIGKPWDLDRATGGIHVLHPHLGYRSADWYRGTADAIYQNMSMLETLDCDYILILSGDHVYNMDYSDFLEFHEKSGNPVTVAVTDVPRNMTKHFGIATVNASGKITRFDEKPAAARSALASMGIYIFDRRFLMSTLERMKKSYEDLDFGKHIIPDLVDRGKISAFRYGGFWLDIGTLKAYYQASLSLLSKRPRLLLSDGGSGVMTVPDDYPPLSLLKNSNVERSMICNGSVIAGSVRSSVLSPGVIVEKGAVVEDSVILQDCVIGRGARVIRSILDKEVRVGSKAVVGLGNARTANDIQPEYLDFGITLAGKGTRIPSGIRIGTNCLISGRIPRKDIPDGGSSVSSESLV
jgi:glucose-1-phosphate adenylyltransferase